MARQLSKWKKKYPGPPAQSHAFHHWREITGKGAAPPEGTISSYLTDQLPADENDILPVVTIVNGLDETYLPALLNYANQHAGYGFDLRVRSNKNFKFEKKILTTVVLRQVEGAKLNDCMILNISLVNSVGPVTLTNCDIGLLHLEGQVHELEIHNCRIDGFSLRNTNIQGPVTLRNVTLPKRQDSVQSLRNFRKSLLEIHNLDAAGVVHAADLRISRAKQNRFERFIGWIYDLISGYGTLTWRPFALFLLSVLLAASLLYFTRATALALPNPAGWQIVVRSLIAGGVSTPI